MSVTLLIANTAVSTPLMERPQFTRSSSGRGTASGGVMVSEFAAAPGMTFVIYEGSTRVWGGIITNRTFERIGPVNNYDTIQHLFASSWEYLLSKRRIPFKRYTGMSAIQIAQSAVTEFATNDNVSWGVMVGGATAEQMGDVIVRGKSVAELLDDLAQASNCIWYLDPEVRLYFVPIASAEAGSIVISSANQNFYNPTCDENTQDYANVVRTEVDWALLTPVTHTFVGDGSSRSFDMPTTIDHVVSVHVNAMENDFDIGGSGNEALWYYTTGSDLLSHDPDQPVLTADESVTVVYHTFGSNILTLPVDPYSDAEVIARAVIEDSSGIYDRWLDTSGATSLDAVNNLLANYLARHCPSKTGAPFGTLPKTWKLSVRSRNVNPEDLQPGKVVSVNITTGPVTGGPKNLLITDVSAVTEFAENDNYLEYTCTLTQHILLADDIQWFRANYGPASGGDTSISGGGGRIDVPSEGGIVPDNPTGADYALSIVAYAREATGQPKVNLEVLVTSTPANAEYYTVWGYRGATPPSDPSLWEPLVDTAVSTVGSTSLRWWMNREEAGFTLQVAVTSNTFTHTRLPEVGIPTKSIVIPAIADAQAVTGFSIVVEPHTIDGTLFGRYKYFYTPPNDLEYKTANIYRIRRANAAYDVLPGAEWGDPMASFPESHEQPYGAWKLPPSIEYWTGKAVPVNQLEWENEAAAVFFNFSVPAADGIDLGAVKEASLGKGLQKKAGKLAFGTENLENLVFNGSFEDGLSQWSTINSVWVADAPAGSPSGNKCAYINNNGQYNVLYQEVVGVVGGQRYQVEVWANPWGAVGTSFLIIADYYSSTGFIGGQSKQLWPPSSGNSPRGTAWTWTKLTMELDIPTGCNKIQFQLVVPNSGVATALYWLVDSVTIIRTPVLGDGLETKDDGTLVISHEDTTNTLTNPSFEFGSTDWEFIPYVAGQVPDVQIISDFNVAADGGKYLRINADGPDVSVDHKIFKVRQGDILNMTVMYMAEAGAGGSPYSRLRFFDKSMNITGESGDAQMFVNVGSWSTATIPYYKAPANSVWCKPIVWSSNNASGYWRIDNVLVQRGVGSAQIESSALGELRLYPNDKRPTVVVANLPGLPDAQYPQGQTVFNIADGMIYRNVSGVTWTAQTRPADLAAGTIASVVLFTGEAVLTKNGLVTRLNNALAPDNVTYFGVTVGDAAGDHYAGVWEKGVGAYRKLSPFKVGFGLSYDGLEIWGDAPTFGQQPLKVGIYPSQESFIDGTLRVQLLKLMTTGILIPEPTQVAKVMPASYNWSIPLMNPTTGVQWGKIPVILNSL